MPELFWVEKFFLKTLTLMAAAPHRAKTSKQPKPEVTPTLIIPELFLVSNMCTDNIRTEKFLNIGEAEGPQKCVINGRTNGRTDGRTNN